MNTRPRPPKPDDLRPNRQRDRLAIDEPARESAPPRTPGKFRKLGKLIVILVVAALAWTAWAGYALYDLACAVQSLDPIALERRVDWVAVQQGLREDLAVAASSDAVTRHSVARAVQRARLDSAESGSDRFWSRIEYIGYTGGPFAFRVDLRPDGGTDDAAMTLLFKWSGDWRLARVFLPGTASAPAPFAERADVFPPPPAQPSPPSQSSPPARPAASSGAKAILFEEDSTDPQGKRYEGSVAWQIELTAPTAGGVREPVVRADISMPTRPLAMTLWIRRNTDKTLPASHTIEIKFDLPADSTTGGIREVPGIMLKPSEDGRGTRLAGISVNVAPNVFLIGLSAIELDVELNVRLLKDRSWFDIPVGYTSRNRAVLAVEKGPIGEKIIADALALWERTAVSEQSEQKKK